MHIFFWILIIAFLALIINSIFLLQMKNRNTIRLAPVIVVTAVSYLIAIVLYLIAASHGTDVLDSNLAASFTVDPESYKTTVTNGKTVYSFHCDNGIFLCFDTDHLLSEDSAPADTSAQIPGSVDVYSCQVRTGFSWCYFNHGMQVRYVLH